MTRRSPLTSKLTMAQRRQFHLELQEHYGHYIPGLVKRELRTYRATRRNLQFNRGRK